MNDRPSSGQYPETGYDGLSTTTFAGESAYVSYETQGQGYNYAAYGSYDAYGTGTYDTTSWVAQDGYPAAGMSTIPAQTAHDDALTTGQWDAGAWTAPNTGYQATASSFGYDNSAEQTGHWAVPGYSTFGTETGAFDATAWNTVAETPYAAAEPEQQPYAYTYAEPHTDGYSETAVFDAVAGAPEAPETVMAAEATEVIDAVDGSFDGFEDADQAPGAVHDMPTQAMPVTLPRASRRAAAPAKGGKGGKTAKVPAGGSSRRRTPAKRSALLTVAVPSACVMGVAGVAAASVGGLTATEKPAEDTTTMAAPDPASVKPVAANSKLDTQLTALSADADNFADRASRTQERIDLRQRQEDEKKRKAEEAAAKEAARPKFAIPVEQQGLSARFGQAGGMWMSVHTGIDFPVGYGTPVMAATDGTVRTQYNSAYGNMAIVTAPDGTETWYCHLSSTKIRGGQVKAGDVIAYSGNSGNSTGPHLHFEVRPGGGSAVDPLAWLRSHGLDPT